MNKPRIAVASLGGTITMLSNGAIAPGVLPQLNVDALLSTVPALVDIAELKTETLATVPGASLEFHNLRDALDWARSAALEGVDGVVLVQGTDTIEETAYLFDLHWDRPEPVVFTGAMRSPETPGFDGPANLLSSVLVAAAPESRGLGVLVVMNDEVHVAARVRKTRASGLNAFASPGFGPIAYVEEGRVVYGSRPARWPHLSELIPLSAPRVVLLETYLGDDAGLLDLAAATGFDGIVLAGFGVGHVSSNVAQSVSRALEVCPVVLASRTGAGTTFKSTYGFIGSETDLLSRGAISAGWLDARKARLLLSCLIFSGHDRKGIHAEFSLRGASPSGPK